MIGQPPIEGERRVQFVICTATLTPQLLKSINTYIPNIKPVITGTIHRSIDTLEQRFTYVVGGEKHAGLEKILKDTPAQRTLVFCNTVSSCRSTEHKLRELEFAATTMHGEMPPKVRVQNWNKFVDGDAPYLVCTDLASRGLDTTMVDHVVMFDFPLNTIDYLHRAGRTARAGGKGIVTSIVGKKDKVLADGIIQALKEGISLEQISADKKINEKFFGERTKEKHKQKEVKKEERLHQKLEDEDKQTIRRLTKKKSKYEIIRTKRPTIRVAGMQVKVKGRSGRIGRKVRSLPKPSIKWDPKTHKMIKIKK